MKQLLNALQNIMKPKLNKLLIVDGDSIQPSMLLENIDPNDFLKIQVYCDTNNHKKFVDCRELYNICFYLSNPEKDAADKALITELLGLAVDQKNSIKRYPGGVYIAANDKGYLRAISIFSRKYPTTVLSRYPILTGIPTLQSSITIPKNNVVFTQHRNTARENLHDIVKQGMSLSTVGLLLRKHDITYNKLAPFLTARGFLLDSKNMKVTQLPMLN